MESSVSEIYEFTKNRINMALELSAQEFPVYEGLSNIYDYIYRSRQFIMDQIKTSLETSEFKAKGDAEKAVNFINSLGKTELGEEFMSNRKFQSDLMFTKKKHISLKALSVAFDPTDLLSPSWEGFFTYLSWGLFGETNAYSDPNATDSQSKHWMSSLGLANYSPAKYWTNPSLLFTSKIPALAVYSWGGARVVSNIVLYGSRFFSWQSITKISSSFLLIGSVLGAAYLIHDLPRALPLKLSQKYKAKLQELDYSHKNAKRISGEVRDVLRFPSREIIKSCETVLGKKQAARRDIETHLHNNSLSLKFFTDLSRRASAQVEVIEQINLDVD